MTLKSDGVLQFKIQKVSAWDRSGQHPTLSIVFDQKCISQVKKKPTELIKLLLIAGFRR